MLALTNWALSKPTFQSSTFGEFLSYRAVDGNVDGDIFQGGCSHTRSQADPWWVVDLGQRITVTNVTVVNRVDCCGELSLRQFMEVVLNPNRYIRTYHLNS